MHKHGLKVALVAVLTLIFALGAVGVASAAAWPDLSLSILGDYGITEQQVANISDGFPDGTWQPYAAMPREQFVKMAVDAYKIPLVTPASPTYSDVPASNTTFYPYIEAATAAGLTNGVGGGKFDPASTITREQAAAIIVRWVAAKNGYDLATMYTPAAAAAILAAYPDASAVGPSLVNEMAFAVDFGIVWGDSSGKLAPKSSLIRIQGAAIIIRSLDIIPMVVPVPGVEPVKPAKIELVSPDKAENLIGVTHQYTYKATQADGSPAPGILVDFDSQQSPWYVGNVQPQAALTGPDGKVTVNLISSEVGTERVSAAINGVTDPTKALAIGTKYWLALDEVYIRDATRSSQNNAGVAHTWQAQVIVFGPGPLSTDQQDWYNLIKNGAVAPAKALDAIDGNVDYKFDPTDYSQELLWTADGYHARSWAGIPVTWTVLNGPGQITKIDGAAASGTKGLGATDADGRSTVEINSTVAASSKVTAVADYPGNPYPGQLFNHHTGGPDKGDHAIDWDDQPAPYASATKTWIPHTIGGGGNSPIEASYSAPNIGERKILTITLKDTFGNPVIGKEVTWTMEGVGQFDTDDDRSTTSATDPTKNIDIDNTDALGQAQVFVESNMPGEQIVIAKYQQKPQGGEPPYLTPSAVVQWFDVNVATFDDPTTSANEALSTNNVGTTHDYTLHVYGLKLEKDELTWDLQRQTSFIDGDQQGQAMNGIFDAQDAGYYGGILLVNPNDLGPGAVVSGGKVISNPLPKVVTVRGKAMTLSLVGGFTQFDYNKDALMEPFSGRTGIYMPLPGKTATFKVSNGTDGMSNLGVDFLGTQIAAVGTVSPVSAVTDAKGEAVATVASQKKGPETIQATVDWPDNPHNDIQLIKAYAKKIWQAVAANDITVSLDSTVVAKQSVAGLIATPTNPVNATDRGSEGGWGTTNIAVHVVDQFGNDLPDYEVVYTLVDAGLTTNGGGQDAADTYHPLAYFSDLTPNGKDDTNGTRPDSNEPRLLDDPYAPIVGPGGTLAFYFNQLQGADFPGGQYDVGGTSPFTDGAKAWTLNGFNRDPNGQLKVNTLTGSNVDLVLAENPFAEGQPVRAHVKSLVKIFVYAPANGVVMGGTPIWSTTIHKIWYQRVATTITLAPTADVALANGVAQQTVTATVLDQYGIAMPGVPVTFTSVQSNGAGVLLVAVPAAPVTTNASGQAQITWTEPSGSMGRQVVTAHANGHDSNKSTIDWALNDLVQTYLVAKDGSNQVTFHQTLVVPGDWTAQVYDAPGGTLLGSGTVTQTTTDLSITLNRSLVMHNAVWLKLTSTTNVPPVFWVYTLAN